MLRDLNGEPKGRTDFTFKHIEHLLACIVPTLSKKKQVLILQAEFREMILILIQLCARAPLRQACCRFTSAPTLYLHSAFQGHATAVSQGRASTTPAPHDLGL